MLAAAVRMLGPSPRVWGLPATPTPPPARTRAIPTCVGTTALMTGGTVLIAGHPHVCGDYAHLLLAPHLDQGHPHVCGDYLDGVFACEVPDRAIPTCVGTTTRSESSGSRYAGHPHVCGDYAIVGEV